MNGDNRIPLRRLSGSRASIGDLAVWDGTMWKPQAPPPAVTSTAQDGLPSYVGRIGGDLAYDMLTGQEYVLGGTSGSSAVDNFNRPDAATVGPTTSSGAAYGGPSSPLTNSSIVSGQLKHVSDCSYFVNGSAGSQLTSMSFYPAHGADLLHLHVKTNVTGTQNYQAQFFLLGGFMELTVFTSSGTLNQASAVGGHTTGTRYDCEFSYVTGQLTARMTDMTTGAFVTVSASDSAYAANTWGGYGFASPTPGSFADNFSFTDMGTLAWSPVRSAPPIATLLKLGVD